MLIKGDESGHYLDVYVMELFKRGYFKITLLCYSSKSKH